MFNNQILNTCIVIKKKKDGEACFVNHAIYIYIILIIYDYYFLYLGPNGLFICSYNLLNTI